jgi:sporulation protein YlmC with PRC-barrel domain
VGRALDRATGETNRDAAGSAVPGAVRTPGATTGTTGTGTGTMSTGTTGSGTMGTTGTATMGAATGAAATGAAMQQMGEHQRVSQIIGSRIYNDRNEAIGEVDDVILSGSSHTAIISVGGFLGLGARLVQVPLADIRWNAERERMMLPGATKEQLQSRPAFDYATMRRG